MKTKDKKKKPVAAKPTKPTAKVAPAKKPKVTATTSPKKSAPVKKAAKAAPKRVAKAPVKAVPKAKAKAKVKARPVAKKAAAPPPTPKKAVAKKSPAKVIAKAPAAKAKPTPSPKAVKPAPKKAPVVETKTTKKATKSLSIKEQKPVTPAKVEKVVKPAPPIQVTREVEPPKVVRHLDLKKKKGIAVSDEKSMASATNMSRSTHLKKLLALKAEHNKMRKQEAKAAEEREAKAAAEAAVAARKREKKKAPYTKAEMKELHDALLEEKTLLLKDLKQLDDLADSNRETTHATFSSHQADAASEGSALENTYLHRRLEEERYSQVMDALQRIEEGTYGQCDACLEELSNLCPTCPFIPVGRLRAKPFAKLCLPLRQQMEKARR